MNHRLSCIAAIAIASSGLSGCIPKHKTIQPEAEILLTDSSGAPIEGATVVLGIYRGPFGPLSQREFLSDLNGRVAIEAERDWEVDVYLPDGVSWYEWSLCVSRPGFQAVALPEPEFGRPIRISLAASDFHSECHWLDNQNPPEVVDWKAGAWIEVTGGAWTNNVWRIAGFSEQMQAFAEPHLQTLRREVRPWSEYLFQYQGRMTGTTRYVYIKALCHTPTDVNLREAFHVAATDPCSFAVTYDVTRGRFDGIEIDSDKPRESSE